MMSPRTIPPASFELSVVSPSPVLIPRSLIASPVRPIFTPRPTAIISLAPSVVVITSFSPKFISGSPSVVFFVTVAHFVGGIMCKTGVFDATMK